MLYEDGVASKSTPVVKRFYCSSYKPSAREDKLLEFEILEKGQQTFGATNGDSIVKLDRRLKNHSRRPSESQNAQDQRVKLRLPDRERDVAIFAARLSDLRIQRQTDPRVPARK